MWLIFWSSAEHPVLSQERVKAKSPKIAIKKFTTMYPDRVFRGMATPDLPVGQDIPETKPRKPYERRSARPVLVRRPVSPNVGRYSYTSGLGADDLIDPRQDWPVCTN